MIDLTKKVLPDSVMVSGKSHKVKTDFQYWLMLEIRLGKGEIRRLDDADFLYDGEIPEDRQAGLDALVGFLRPRRELPRDMGGSCPRLLDYELDADLIYSAFYEQYGLDLVDKSLHLHWHKFRALLEGLHSTRLNDIMGYRSFDDGKKETYESTMKKLRAAWELPEVISMSEEEKKMADDFEKMLY